MDSIQEMVQTEKAIKKVEKLNQRYYLRIFETLNQQKNQIKSIKPTVNTNDLSSLSAYYEHQILDLSELPLSRADYFISTHCIFCKDKSKKKFKLKSFKENKKRTTFLFKICSACGKWEKLHEAKMIKPLKKKSKRKKSELNKSNESIKLTKFNLNDLEKLKYNLKNI